MKGLLAALFASLAACLGLLHPGTADASFAVPAPAFSYDGHHRSSLATQTTTDLSPPSYRYVTTTIYDAVDRRSDRVSVRQQAVAAAAAAPAARAYDGAGQLSQAAQATATSREPIRVADGRSAVLDRGRVATKTRKLDNVDGLPCNCFVAGTKVQTSNGETQIEDIKVGDSVWANDLDTGESHLRTVTGLFQKHADEGVCCTDR